MNTEITLGIWIPLLGTILGAGTVFFMKEDLKPEMKKILSGFAAGVMAAASVWSLILPSLEMSESSGKWAIVPTVVGFMIGIFFLLILDQTIPHLHLDENKSEGLPSTLSNKIKMVLAVTLHNIPEGMVVGVVYAGMIHGNQVITQASAIALAIGIAIQNFPEGAIISMPLKAEGLTSWKAFLYGIGSGVVEPIGSYLTIFAIALVVPVLPYFLSFAAGAMVYVVVEELIPESAAGGHSNKGTVAFAVGFCLMMILDIVLG